MLRHTKALLTRCLRSNSLHRQGPPVPTFSRCRLEGFEHLEDRSLLDGASPQVVMLQLVNDTGVSATDGITADPRTRGVIANDDGIAGIGIDIDLDGDGTVDQTQYTDVDGAFTFAPPTLSPGVTTVWARAVENDTVTGDPLTGNWLSLSFTFAPEPNQAPVIASVGLIRDTGVSGTDLQTIDPGMFGIVTNSDGSVGGITVEMDVNGDGIADLQSQTDASGKYVLTPESLATGSVTVQLRSKEPLHQYTNTAFVTGPWTPFTFTLQPVTAAEVSQLKLANDTGSSATDNVTADPTLVGVLTVPPGVSPNGLFVGIDVTGDGQSDFHAATDATGKFAVTPGGLAAGTMTVKARYEEWDASEGVAVTSNWVSLTFTYQGTTPPVVTGLQLLNDDGPSATDGSTTDPTVVGTVTDAVTPVGQEIEIDTDGDGVANDQIVTDGKGQFTYRPVGLSPGTVTVQARGRILDPKSEEYLYSGWSSITFTLNSTAPVPGYVSSLALVTDDGASNADNVTTDPTIRGIVIDGQGAPVSQLVELDWTGDGVADGFVASDETGAFSYRPDPLDAGYIKLAARARVQTGDSNQDNYGSWANFSFTLVGETNQAPTVSTLKLANDTGTYNWDNVTTDPTVIGTVTDPDGPAAYLQVEYDTDSDGIADGFTTTDYQGKFSIKPTDLRFGGVTVKVRAVEYDTRTGDQLYSLWQPLSFTLQQGISAPVADPSEVGDASSNAARVGFNRLTGQLGASATADTASLVVGAYRYTPWQDGGLTATDGEAFQAYSLTAVPSNVTITETAFSDTQTYVTSTGSYTVIETGSHQYQLTVTGQAYTVSTRIYYTYTYDGTNTVGTVWSSLHQTGTYLFSMTGGGSYASSTGIHAGNYSIRESTYLSYDYQSRDNYTLTDPGWSGGGLTSVRDKGDSLYDYSDVGTFSRGGYSGGSTAASLSLSATVSSNYTLTSNGTYSLTDAIGNVGGSSSVTSTATSSIGVSNSWNLSQTPYTTQIYNGSISYDSKSDSGISAKYTGTFGSTSAGSSESGGYSIGGTASSALSRYSVGGSYSETPSDSTFVGGYSVASSSGYQVGRSSSGNYSQSTMGGTTTGTFSSGLSASAMATSNDAGPYSQSLLGTVTSYSLSDQFSYNSSASASASHKVTTDSKYNILGVSVALNYSITNQSTDKALSSTSGTYTADTNSWNSNGNQSFTNQSTLTREWIGGGSIKVNTSAVSLNGQIGVSRTNVDTSFYQQSGNFSIDPSGKYTLNGGQYSRSETASATHSMTYGGGASLGLLGSGVSGGFNSTQTGNSLSSYSESSGSLTITDQSLSASGTFGALNRSYTNVSYSFGGGYRLSVGSGYDQGSFTSTESGVTSISQGRSGTYSRKDDTVTSANGPFDNLTSKSSTASYTANGNFSWSGGQDTGGTSLNRKTTSEMSYSEGGTLSKTLASENVTGGSYNKNQLGSSAETTSVSGHSTGAYSTRDYSRTQRQNSSTSLTDSGSFSRTNGTLSSSGTQINSVSASGSYDHSLTATYDYNVFGQSVYRSATNTGSGSRSVTNDSTTTYDRGNTDAHSSGNANVRQKVLNDQTVIAKGSSGFGLLGNTRTSSYSEKEIKQTSTTGTDSYGFSINGTAAEATTTLGGALAAVASGMSSSGASTTQTSTFGSDSYTGTVTYSVTLPGYTNKDTSSRTQRGSTTSTSSNTTSYTQAFGADARSTSGAFKSNTDTNSSVDFSVTMSNNWTWTLSGGRSWGDSTKTGFEESTGSDVTTNGAFKSIPSGGSSRSAQETLSNTTKYKEQNNGNNNNETRNGRTTTTNKTVGADSRYSSSSYTDTATYVQSSFQGEESGRNGTFNRKEYADRSGDATETVGVTNGPAPFTELQWGSYGLFTEEAMAMAVGEGSGPTYKSQGNRVHRSSYSESSFYTETFSYKNGASAGSPGGGGSVGPMPTGGSSSGGGTASPGNVNAESASGTFTNSTSYAELSTNKDDSTTGFSYSPSAVTNGNGTSGYSTRTYKGNTSEGWKNTSNETGSFSKLATGQDTTVTGNVTDASKQNTYSASYNVTENHDYTYRTSTTTGYTSTTTYAGTSGADGEAKTSTGESDTGGYTKVGTGDMDWTSGQGKKSEQRDLNSKSNRSLRYESSWSSTGTSPSNSPSGSMTATTGGTSTSGSGGGRGYNNSTDIASTSYTYHYDKTDTTTGKGAGGVFSLKFNANEKTTNKTVANGWGDSATKDGNGANIISRAWTKNSLFSSGYTYTISGTATNANTNPNAPWKKVNSGENSFYFRETMRYGNGDPQTTSNSYSSAWSTTSTNSNPTGATPSTAQWLQLGLDVVSIFDPTGLTAIASIGISIYNGEDVTLLAVLGAVPLVGKAAKIAQVSAKVLSRIEKGTKVIQGTVAVVGVVNGGRQVVQGVKQLDEGSNEMGAYNLLRGLANVAGGIKGVAGAVKGYRSAAAATQGNQNVGGGVGCKPNGPRCFVEGTPVVIGEEVDEALLGRFLQLLESGELVLERGFLDDAAQDLFNRAESLEDVLGLSEWQRQAMGVSFLAIGVALGGWYAIRMRRKDQRARLPEDMDPFDPLNVDSDEAMNDILRRLRAKTYDCLIPLDC